MYFENSTTSFEYYERIEFGFVLLPEDHILQKIKSLSETIYNELQHFSIQNNLPNYWGTYINKKVEIPHISLGQYGALGCELEDIKKFVNDVSKKTSTFTECMKPHLSVLDDHIFFDVKNCFENVNTQIGKLYVVLRELYFGKIQTKFPIAQSLLNRKKYPHNTEELNLIDQYFQNWGIPEGHRLRPHFTLLYHPPFKREEMEKHLSQNANIQTKINELDTILLSRIGVIQIDTFGNPLRDGLICVFPLLNGG